jgi:hypothetical protein
MLQDKDESKYREAYWCDIMIIRMYPIDGLRSKTRTG